MGALRNMGEDGASEGEYAVPGEPDDASGRGRPAGADGRDDVGGERHRFEEVALADVMGKAFRAAETAFWIVLQLASGVLLTVIQSVAISRLVTPGMANRVLARGSPAASALER